MDAFEDQKAMSAASGTCLVIDNEVAFATFVQRVAEGMGLHTQILTDPIQLEQTLAVSSPDIITLDTDMPGRNGLEVLRVLSAWRLERRVIMISGTPPDHTSAGRPRVAGFEIAAILMKPARKVEIESALAAALDMRDDRRHSDSRPHVPA
ncbi:response regulator [Dongia deserti]|uniref:response regulator n=1 Tax=Dongia deserti TaxID=2268030 RepID=UPI000E65CB2D|nr:response regulator [Dongia deserti]